MYKLSSRALGFFSISLCMFLFCSVTNARRGGESTKRFAPQVELTAKKGITGKKAFKRDIGRLGFVYPVYQNNKSVAFFTLIGMGDTNKAFEGNFGGGYRVIKNRSAIIGGYLFYDLRLTPSKNKVHQVTIGGEFMYSALETRVNVYLPLTKEKAIKDYDKYHAKYNGRTTSIKSYRHNVSEVLLNGFDIEAGGFLPVHNKLSGFLAFYHFGRSGTGAKSINGIRFRTNYSFIDWFSAEGECSNDATAGFVSYLGVKFNWSPARNRKSINAKSKLINRRMTQLPVRDVDAVTANVDKIDFNFHHNIAGEAAIYTLDPDAEFELDNVKAVTTIKEANALKKAGINNIQFIDAKRNVTYLAKNDNTHKVELVKGNKTFYPKESSSKTLKEFKVEKLDHKIFKKHYDPKSKKNTSKALKKVIGIKLEQKTMTVEQALSDKILSNDEIIRNALKKLQTGQSTINDAIAIIKKAKKAGATNKEIALGVFGVFTPSSIEELKQMIKHAEQPGKNKSDKDSELPPMINPEILQHVSKLLIQQGLSKNDILDGTVRALEKMYHALKYSIPASAEERKMADMMYKAKTHHFKIASMIMMAPQSQNQFTIDDLYGSSLKNGMVAGAVIGSKLRNQSINSILTTEMGRFGGVTHTDIARGAIEFMDMAGPMAGFRRQDVLNAGISLNDLSTADFQFGLARGVSLRDITRQAMFRISQPYDVLTNDAFVNAARNSGITKNRLLSVTPNNLTPTINGIYV